MEGTQRKEDYKVDTHPEEGAVRAKCRAPPVQESLRKGDKPVWKAGLTRNQKKNKIFKMETV